MSTTITVSYATCNHVAGLLGRDPDLTECLSEPTIGVKKKDGVSEGKFAVEVLEVVDILLQEDKDPLKITDDEILQAARIHFKLEEAPEADIALQEEEEAPAPEPTPVAASPITSPTTTAEPVIKRGRGRPPKNPVVAPPAQAAAQPLAAEPTPEVAAAPVKRGRGRPPKSATAAPVEVPDTSEDNAEASPVKSKTDGAFTKYDVSGNGPKLIALVLLTNAERMVALNDKTAGSADRNAKLKELVGLYSEALNKD